MKRIVLALAMVISVLFCFAHLGFCETGLILIEYDANNSTLVGITSPDPNFQFVSINFSTGLLTPLNGNVGDNLLTGFKHAGVSTASCVSGSTFYAIRWRKATPGDWLSMNICYIVSINMSTGQLVESPALHF